MHIKFQPPAAACLACLLVFTSSAAYSGSECKLDEAQYDFSEISESQKMDLHRLATHMYGPAAGTLEEFSSNERRVNTAAFAAYEALRCEKFSGPIKKFALAPQINASKLLQVFSSYYKKPKSIGALCFREVQLKTKTCFNDESE